MTKSKAEIRLEELREEEKKIEAERREIYAQSLLAAKEDKVCSDDLAEMLKNPPKFKYIKYPVTISNIAYVETKVLQPDLHSSKWVSIAPCNEKKTYLGILLGDMALGVTVQLNKETNILHVGPGHFNPAIYVPDLNKVIFGCESWWSEIEKPEDLKQITDQDINNTWYVKALKELE